MKILIAACFITLITLFPARAQGGDRPKSLRLNTENFPPLSKLDGIGLEDLLAKEVYNRLGISVNLNYVPSERALVNANAGVDDGILPRTGGMAAKYPNLVQFEEPVLTRDYVAFSRRNDIKILGWESLKPYHVAIITGWKIFERNIKNTKSLVKVKNATQLFSLLSSGRADLVAYARLGGLQIVKERNIPGVLPLDPPLAKREVFFYLHKKHSALIGPASAALRTIKADGTYQRIYDRVIKSLLVAREDEKTR